jgi:hypothetical protein
MRAILDENEFACYSKNSNNTTRPVLPIKGTRTNSFGLLDMLGNLREWCMDWYSDDFYTCCTVRNFKNFKKEIIGKEEISYKSNGVILEEGEPYNEDVFTFDKNGNCINPVKKKPGKFEAKCLRGGCYDWNESNLRPTYRNHNPANNVYKVNGFRIVFKEIENPQNELKHRKIEDEIIKKNIQEVDEYTYNSVIINFDKNNKTYQFIIEKHFTIKSNVIPSIYSFQVLANKFFDIDSKQSIEFYKQNPLEWNKLNVNASIFYQNIGDNDFSNEINLFNLKHENTMDNVIRFEIHYETIEGAKIPFKKGAKIKLIYGYDIPAKLWGNYMLRPVSSSSEPTRIELKNYDNDLVWEIEEVFEDESGDQMKEGYGYKKLEKNLIEISRNKPLARYRVIWDAEKYFEIKELNTFKIN